MTPPVHFRGRWSALCHGCWRWGSLFLLYGPNTLFFFLYTWPFFLALMPVSVIIGIALHLLVKGQNTF
ncbi:membrane protein [Salmonella enterica subsp. enterica]|uniref:Membrane protein n=1 Tax=Salmonella enterica I TaxID=59201 RepID=A0A3S4HST3_SALET|nr:membrane protein [Salmonella enterica subsp. enterica]